MSEPRLISPMLDAFDMGGAISDHDGVKCCPAMRRDSDEKYIVKIISVPASQTKLDALLLTGAYPDKESALSYFKDVADGIVAEKRILDDLSHLEGFVPFEDCQIVPKDDATGYDVYLMSPYRLTLDRQLAKAPMTQLGAVNLGIDLCAALAICRQSGYLCVDIKPSNIVQCGEQSYCIGDLGFTSLTSLRYASLPEKYFSNYTAPEVVDAFSSLSQNMDIYSVGLVLYQIYNDGKLPFDRKRARGEQLAAPVFADDEMAQIILKACDPDPEQRWQDPVEMGQALVSYMQKNSVNDTPLTCEYFSVTEQIDASVTEEIIDNPAETEELIVPEAIETLPAVESVAETTDEEVISEEVEATEEIVELSEQEAVDPVQDDAPEIAPNENSEEQEDIVSEDASEDVPDEASDDEVLSFYGDEEEISVDYDVVSDDVSEMLEQIDALAAHPIPEPPVAPDPIEIKLPDPEPESEVVADDADDESEMNEETPEEDPGTVENSDESEETDPTEMPYVPKKKRTGLTICIILLILIGLGVGGYFFYQDYYLQPIHTLTLEGAEDRLQVQLTADIDESYLSVVCADSHGNKIPAPVVGGTAVFTGLAPDTAYTVSVEVDGFHKLTGVTSKVYSTPVQTQIAQISVVTGSEGGSVILSFTVEGPDSDQWNVIYNADGEAERVTAFPSHMVTLTGLTVGKEYTFRLEPVDEIYISGNTEVNYVAKDLVCAENLHITACSDGVLTAQWDTPKGAQVSLWSVRCHNENGFDQTITTEENTASFEGIDETLGYFVDVTAADMSVNQRIVVSPNSITVGDFTVDASRTDILTLSWNANKEIPAGGWTVRYSVDGVFATESVTTAANTVQVPVVPNGNYVFTILDDAGNAVLGGPFEHTQAEAADFEGYSVSKSDVTIRLCNTPSASSWSYKDLSDDDYVNSFPIGQKISAVLSLSGNTSSSDDSMLISYLIYDEDGKLVSFTNANQTWRSMWYENYCELDITGTPTSVGTYELILLFNGMEVGSQKFAITN